MQSFFLASPIIWWFSKGEITARENEISMGTFRFFLRNFWFFAFFFLTSCAIFPIKRTNFLFCTSFVLVVFVFSKRLLIGQNKKSEFYTSSDFFSPTMTDWRKKKCIKFFAFHLCMCGTVFCQLVSNCS